MGQNQKGVHGGRGWCEETCEPETLQSPNGKEGTLTSVQGRGLKLEDHSDVSMLSEGTGSSLTL